MKIEISCDCFEAEEFAEWLNARGHSAHVGNTSRHSINGVECYDLNEDPAARNAVAVFDDLYSAYCRES